MVVDLSLILQVGSVNIDISQALMRLKKKPHVVNDASEQDINEGDGEVEEEPDVNHLDVGGDW